MEEEDGLTRQIQDTLIFFEMKHPGFIGKDQLALLLEELGIVMTPGELVKFQESFSKVSDSKGLIPREEVRKDVDPRLRRLNAEQLQAYIEIFDRDKDGKISREDLDFALTNFGRGLSEEDLGIMYKLVGDQDPVDIAALSAALSS